MVRACTQLEQLEVMGVEPSLCAADTVRVIAQSCRFLRQLKFETRTKAHTDASRAVRALGTHCSLLEELNATIGSTVSDGALERLVQGCTRLRHLTLRADRHAPDLGLSSVALLAVGRCARGLQTLDLGPLP